MDHVPPAGGDADVADLAAVVVAAEEEEIAGLEIFRAALDRPAGGAGSAGDDGRPQETAPMLPKLAA